MKLDFCAVCGVKENLHQHHIEPVVYSAAKRNSRKYDENKKLKECEILEVWGYLFDKGYISDDATITVCEYHHNLMHGIVKFTRASQSTMIKEGMKKAIENGRKIGRPSKITDELALKIKHSYSKSLGIRDIAKKYEIGIGTVYAALNLEVEDLSNNEFDELSELIENNDSSLVSNDDPMSYVKQLYGINIP